MRFTLNLARAPSFRERHGFWIAVPGLLLALLWLAWMSTSTLSNFRQLRGVDQSTAGLQSRKLSLERSEIALKQDLARPQSHSLIREARYVNGLIQARKFSLAELTFKVSKLMPAEVRLDSLALARAGDEPLIRFTVEGKTELDIEAFLTQFENSDEFSDIIVTSQGYSGSGGQGPVLTTCTAQYMGGALPEETGTNFNARTETTDYSSNR